MIRLAKTKDLKDIIELYKKGLNELGYTDWKESLLVKKVTESFVLAPCILLEVDGIVKGMAGFTIVKTSHNGVATLADYMFYVEPEVRNIKNLSGLVQVIRDFADANNLPVRLEFVTNNEEPVKRRLLKMNGFKVGGIIGFYNGQ